MERKGSLRARAEAAGMSIEAFANQHRQENSEVGKMARMYFVAQSPGDSGKSKMDEPGDNRRKRNPLYQVG
jgi:hypothetical protein